MLYRGMLAVSMHDDTPKLQELNENGCQTQGLGPQHKEEGSPFKSPQSKSHCIFLAMLLLAISQFKAGTGFASKPPTVDAGVVMRLKVSYRLFNPGL